MMTRVTLRAIAKQAGVSRNTVSLALRNSPRLSMATGDRIRNLAREMGYRPDPDLVMLMDHLRTHRGGRVPRTLAFLDLGGEPRSGAKQPHLRSLTDAAARRAKEIGYRMDILRPGVEGLSDDRLGDVLWNRGIVGLLIGPARLPGRELVLPWERFAALQFGYSVQTHGLHRISFDHFDSVMIAMEALRARGYRRIGMALQQRVDHRTLYHNHAAFLVSQRLCPARERVPLYLPEEFEREAFLRWVGRARPDAILLASASRSPTLLQWLNDGGWSVPGRMGFATLHLLWPDSGISGIDQREPEMAASAVDFLDRQLRAGDRGLPSVPMTLHMAGRWVDGATTVARTDERAQRPPTGPGRG